MKEDDDMLNFTLGPVQTSEVVRSIGAEQIPYFRTAEFSEMMFENERMIKELTFAEEEARTVFLTGSGTASMEAAIASTLTEQDKVLIVNGGSFGQRFVELCQLHEIPYTEITLAYGKALTEEELYPHENKGYTCFCINVHETSTGVHYDMSMVSQFCKRNGLLLIVDAISSFLADPFDMKAFGVDVMIIGSQKGLACPPGISIVVLSARAVARVKKNNIRCLYLNLKRALMDGERGQTPFTPAVGILRQIHARLKEIQVNGGIEQEIWRVARLADDFRQRIINLPFEVASESMSNAATPLHPMHVSAYDVFLTLKDQYGIWVCPNGGALKEKIFRVGHIGALTIADNDVLIEAFEDMKRRGML